MNEYGNTILRLCYTYVHDWQIAEDLTQETFLKINKHYENYRGDAQIKIYIFAIAINVCKDYVGSWKYKKVMVSNTFQQLLKSDDTTLSEVVDLMDETPVVIMSDYDSAVWTQVIGVKDHSNIVEMYVEKVETGESMRFPIDPIKDKIYYVEILDSFMQHEWQFVYVE